VSIDRLGIISVEPYVLCYQKVSYLDDWLFSTVNEMKERQFMIPVYYYNTHG